MGNRQTARHYVAASKMKLLFSLIVLAASIIADIPQAQASLTPEPLTVCAVGLQCWSAPITCPKGQVLVHKTCGYVCCKHK